MNQFADLIPTEQAPFDDLKPKGQNLFDDLIPQQSRLSNAGNAFVQGAGHVLSGVPKAIDIQAAQTSDQMNAVFDKVDAGASYGDVLKMDFPSSNYNEVINYLDDPNNRPGIRQVFPKRGLVEMPLYQAGRKVDRAVNENFPLEKAYEGEFFADLLPQGAGSTAGFALAALATRGVGMGPLLGAAVTGSALQSSSQFQDAVNSGASLEDAYKAADFGGYVGLTEGLPITRLLDRFDTASGGTIKRVLKEGIKGGLEEGLQEFVQQVGSNLIASDLVEYDPERKTFKGTGESAGVGFTIGMLYNTIAAMTGTRLRKVKQSEKTDPQSDPVPAPAGDSDSLSVSGTASGEFSDTSTATVNTYQNQFDDLIPKNQFEDLIPETNFTLNQGGFLVPGSNYQGFVDKPGGPPAPAIQERQKGKPLNRQVILSDFANEVGHPIFEGHMKHGKEVLGFFRPKNKEVRVRNQGDIEVAAHEIAHMIDNKLPDIRAQWKDKTIREELKSVSYDKKNVKEGFAEFVRLWTTQTGQAKESAPKFYDWFEKFVKTNKEYGPALIKAQGSMTAWFDQSAIDRARSKIGEFGQSATKSVASKFRQSVIDDLTGLEAVEKSISGEVKAGGIYETARLSRGAGGVLQGAMTFGAPSIVEGRTVFTDLAGNPSANIKDGKVIANPKYTGGGLETILDPVSDNLEDFGLYAIGKRAAFLKAQGREKLFSDSEITAMQELETPERKKAFQDWNKFNKQILDFAQKSGVINGKARKQWETDVYLPFWRVDKSSGGGKDGKLIKRLTGGTSNVRDPIANMFQNTKMLIEASIVNDAKRKAIKEIAEADNGGQFLVKISKDDKAVHVDKEQIKKEFFDILAEEGGIDPDTILNLEEQFDAMEPFLRFWMHGQDPRGDDIVSFMENGKTEFYQVADPILYRGLANMPRTLTQNPIIQWLKRIKNISQMTITLSTDFMIRNILRDTVMASVLSKHGFVPFVDAAKGFKHRVTKDAVYQEWLANGGAISGFFNDEGDFQRNLETFYKKHGVPYNLVVNTPKKMLGFVQSMADGFEAATRLSEFRRTIAAGGSSKHAAFESRDISSDFAMRGDSQTLGFMYDTVMFLKAGIVGMDRVYRGVAKDSNRGQVALKTGMLAMASIGLYALNRDNPLYDELEDWEKDNHWHFFIPTDRYYKALKEGEDMSKIKPHDLYTHFRFPKPWEIGGIATIAERSLEGVLEKDVSQAGKILKVVREMFRYEFMPQAFKPLYEQATNEISFINRPIETPSMERLAPFARSSASGSRLLREAGESTRNLPKGLQLNPVRTEALLRGYFNTWAMYGLTLADSILYDDMPDIPTNQVPGLRAIYKDGPGSTRYRTMFYDMLKEATEARATMRHMDRSNRKNIGDEIANSPENLQYQQLTGANKYLQSITAEMKQIINASGLRDVKKLALKMKREKTFRKELGQIQKSRAWNDTGALKRELLDLWGYERNRFVKEVVTE